VIVAEVTTQLLTYLRVGIRCLEMGMSPSLGVQTHVGSSHFKTPYDTIHRIKKPLVNMQL
jgi:hypothetical protein